MKIFSFLVATLLLSACANGTSLTTVSSTQNAGTCSTAVATGMTCEACAMTVTTNLKKLDGVTAVDVNVPTGTIRIHSSAGTSPTEADVKKTIEHSGYTFKSLHTGC